MAVVQRVSPTTPDGVAQTARVSDFEKRSGLMKFMLMARALT